MTARTGLALAALLAAVACGKDEAPSNNSNNNNNTTGPYSLTFAGDATYNTAHAGLTIYVAVINETTSLSVASSYAVIGASGFGFSFPNLLEQGVAYHVDYYVDRDADQVCTAPPTDHVWRTAIPAVTQDVSLTDSHDTTFTAAACASFNTPVVHDLTFAGDSTYGTAHNGKTIYLAVVDLTANQVVDGGSTVITGTGFTFSFPGLLDDGVAYRLDYFVDLNGNTVCEANPTDHMWQTSIPAVTADVSLTDSHDTTFGPAACASFPAYDLTFAGDSTYSIHNGQTVFINVVLLPSTIVASDSQTVSATGFTFSFPGMLAEGEDYRLDYYVEFNATQGCQRPGDHVWQTSVPAVTGDVSLTDSHDTNFSTCGTF